MKEKEASQLLFSESCLIRTSYFLGVISGEHGKDWFSVGINNLGDPENYIWNETLEKDQIPY